LRIFLPSLQQMSGCPLDVAKSEILKKIATILNTLGTMPCEG